MTKKLFSLGFSAALVLDVIVLGMMGYLTYVAFFLDFGDLQFGAQFTVLLYLSTAIYYARLVYFDCLRTDKSYPLLRAIVYGILGIFGWQMYYSEYYEIAKDGYITPDERPFGRNDSVMPYSKPVTWFLAILSLSGILILNFFAIRNAIIKGSGNLVTLFFYFAFIFLIVLHTIYRNKAIKIKQKNPFDRDMGGLASVLVLILFIAVVAFLFYYNKYINP